MAAKKKTEKAAPAVRDTQVKGAETDAARLEAAVDRRADLRAAQRLNEGEAQRQERRQEIAEAQGKA